MNRLSQVAADVRKPALSLSKGLTLFQRVRRKKDQSLVTSAATLDWWVQGPNARPKVGGPSYP